MRERHTHLVVRGAIFEKSGMFTPFMAMTVTMTVVMPFRRLRCNLRSFYLLAVTSPSAVRVHALVIAGARLQIGCHTHIQWSQFSKKRPAPAVTVRESRVCACVALPRSCSHMCV